MRIRNRKSLIIIEFLKIVIFLSYVFDYLKTMWYNIIN